MTEQEWMASDDPAAMLVWLTEGHVSAPVKCRRPSDRKLRLFACACFRFLHSFGPMLDPDREAVESAEARADDGVTPMVNRGYWIVLPDAAEAARNAARSAARSTPNPPHVAALLRDIAGNPFEWLHTVGEPRWRTPTVLSLAQAAYEERGRKWKGRSSDHDEETGWIDDGTLDGARLAVLSDALEEAGCGGEVACLDGHMWSDDDASTYPAAHPIACRCKGTRRLPHPLLQHLRSPGPHVRGCWAVDLILGRAA
jgi:hypothetical protein